MAIIFLSCDTKSTAVAYVLRSLSRPLLSCPGLLSLRSNVEIEQSLIAYRDVTDMYRLYLTDKEASGGGEGWGGLGRSLPCVVFRTLYKAKRYEEALEYLDDALASKK